jgi:putative nucleotidyltransferase with HDIG domain/diguanylate cyclase (GGDEF)-like protein
VGYKTKFLNRFAWMIIMAWSLIMLIVGAISIYNNYHYANSLAIHEAKISIQKDLAYRSWVSSHGGVYVPITKETPPNPYLAYIKNRDVTTNDGQHLTLMNPAYTLSQMMHDYAKLYGTKGHITSLILLNPKNKPDDWERKSLQEIDVTHKAILNKVDIENEEYIRYINPMVTKQSCLKCHAFQGYKVGDIRGAVSVSIPLKPYYAQAFHNSIWNIMTTLIVYFIGLIAIFYGKREAKKVIENKIKNYEQHIYSLVNMIEKRDSYTAGHSRRVAKYCVLIAREMGFNEEKVEELYRAAMLHDIGKISTPDSILLKPGRLTDLEFSIIKEHVVVSYELLKDVDIYGDIAEIVRNHHEQYDGSGYPRGLKGDKIPILSQVMTVADAFDAMTTNRIYKTRKEVSVALKELKSLGSKQFNSEVVHAASKALADIEVDESTSQIPKTKLEEERFAYFYKDQMTGVYNKGYLDFVMAYNHTDKFHLEHIYSIFLHHFTKYNKKFSWAEGDIVLRSVAQKLETLCNDAFIFRMYGDDFIVLSKDTLDMDMIQKEVDKILFDTEIEMSYKYLKIKESAIENLQDIEKLM